MITEKEAEKRCLEFLDEYLKSAAPCSEQDEADMLMKMMGVAGLAMYRVVGKEETFKRMISTTAFCCRILLPHAGAERSGC